MAIHIALSIVPQENLMNLGDRLIEAMALYYSPILPGAASYVGVDPTKQQYDNYFYVDDTSNATEIQDAMDYAGDGVCFIEDEDYTVPVPLTPTQSGLTLEGENMQTTIIRLAPGTTHNAIERTDAVPVIFFFTIKNLHVYGNDEITGGDGIYITDPGTSDVIIDHVRVSFCYNGYNVASFSQKVVNLVAEHNVHSGIIMRAPQGHLTNCYSADNDYDGFDLGGEEVLQGCWAAANGRYGFIANGNDVQLIGGGSIGNFLIEAGTKVEIALGADRAIVTGMSIDGDGTSAYGIRVFAGGDDCRIFQNDIRNCLTNDIWVQGARTRIKDNVLPDGINDTVLTTILETIKGEFPLSNLGGGAAAVAPVINTSPGGIDIDANDEFGHVKIPLPVGVQQVVRIKIWAYSNVIEAANNMLLRLVAHGAGSSGLWNGNPIDVANKESVEEGGIVQFDVLHWIFDPSDDAQIGTLAAQDFVEILVVGEGPSAPDIGTDIILGGWEIQIV